MCPSTSQAKSQRGNVTQKFAENEFIQARSSTPNKYDQYYCPNFVPRRRSCILLGDVWKVYIAGKQKRGVRFTMSYESRSLVSPPSNIFHPSSLNERWPRTCQGLEGGLQTWSGRCGVGPAKMSRSTSHPADGVDEQRRCRLINLQRDDYCRRSLSEQRSEPGCWVGMCGVPERCLSCYSFVR